MALSLQVLYPVSDGSTFDYDYYTTKHMEVFGASVGPHVESVVITRGLAGGPDVPAGYHAVATILFTDQDTLDAGLAAAGPALEDIPNFYNQQPQMLIGEVIG